MATEKMKADLSCWNCVHLEDISSSFWAADHIDYFCNNEESSEYDENAEAYLECQNFEEYPLTCGGFYPRII